MKRRGVLIEEMKKTRLKLKAKENMYQSKPSAKAIEKACSAEM